MSFLRIPEQVAGTGGRAASYNKVPGLRVKISRIPGISKGAALDSPYYFQCPPLDQFAHQHSFDQQRYVTLSGEYIRRGGIKLATTSFRSLAVEWGAFVIEPNWDVPALTQSLIDICEEGYPFDLLCTNEYNVEPELHMPAVLESLTVTTQSGEDDARYFDMSFVEWRDPVVVRRKIGAGKPRTGVQNLPTVVTLRKDGSAITPGAIAKTGEPISLAYLAKIYYGKPSYAKYIASANDIKNWGPNSKLISHTRYKSGGKITIPLVSLETRGFNPDSSIG